MNHIRICYCIISNWRKMGITIFVKRSKNIGSCVRNWCRRKRPQSRATTGDSVQTQITMVRVPFLQNRFGVGAMGSWWAISGAKPQAGSRSHISNYKIHAENPYFEGHLHIEDFLKWIQTMEFFLKVLGCPYT